MMAKKVTMVTFKGTIKCDNCGAEASCTLQLVGGDFPNIQCVDWQPGWRVKYVTREYVRAICPSHVPMEGYETLGG